MNDSLLQKHTDDFLKALLLIFLVSNIQILNHKSK